MQETRKQVGYGAKGELAYIIEARNSKSGENEPIMNTDDILKTLKEKWGGSLANKKFLDMGCGDGAQLWQWNKKFGVKWQNVFGISGEDMRGCMKHTGQVDLQEVEKSQ